MNQARAFDTHKSFKRLVEAGADEKLAEAIIDCQSSSQLELATKADIVRLEVDNKLLHWMVGFNLALTSAGGFALIFR